MVMKPAAGRSLDRSKGKVTFKIKKTTCKCDYEINAGNCQKSKFTCDKKCNGNAKGVEVEGGMYVFDLAVKKGKVKVAKCKKEAGAGPSPPTGSGSGPAPTGSGSGSGPVPTGSGSG